MIQPGALLLLKEKMFSSRKLLTWFVICVSDAKTASDARRMKVITAGCDTPASLASIAITPQDLIKLIR